METNIKVGDKVRSFDFEGRRDCYVEGEVIEIKPVDGCERYVILVARDVFGNSLDVGPRVGDKVYPPVNGTRKALGGGVCAFVEKIK